MYTGFHYSGNQSQIFGRTMTFYYVWKISWYSWHLYRNTKTGNIYGILAAFLSLFFLLEKCYCLCNNPEVTQAPDTHPAELLPWAPAFSHVGWGQQKNINAVDIPSLATNFPVVSALNSCLQPLGKSNCEMQHESIYVFCTSKRSTKFNPGLLPSLRNIPKW